MIKNPNKTALAAGQGCAKNAHRQLGPNKKKKDNNSCNGHIFHMDGFNLSDSKVNRESDRQK